MQNEIRGKYNCYIVPSEIDEIILTHPAIEEAATVAIPDPFFGENVKMAVRVGYTAVTRGLT